MYWRDALRARATGLASGRVYWGERPQGSNLPALVLSTPFDGRPQHLKGYSLREGRVQVDAYGRTPEEAWDLQEAALNTLVPGGTFSGHDFSRGDIEIGPHDRHERIGNTTVFRVMSQLMIHHKDTAGQDS